MPIPLSAHDQELYDRVLSYLDSLHYVGNFKYMNDPTNRRQFVEEFRRTLTPNVQRSISLTANHRELYAEMISVLRTVRTDIFAKFNRAANSRGKVVDDFAVNIYSQFIGTLGCGDLCPDKERGCVECA